jgi:hypothetical protein
MISLPKTIGFAAIHLSATVLISAWCEMARLRFQIWLSMMSTTIPMAEPVGSGTKLSNFFDSYAWVGIAVSVVLSGILTVLHIKKHDVLYETIFYVGVFFLVAWFLVAVIAMDTRYNAWVSSRGWHF